RELALVVVALRAQSGDACAERRELGCTVAKGAGLRRAAARAGDLVPAGKQRLTWPARARVDVENEPLARELPQAHRPHGRLEREVEKRETGEMIGGAVVLGRAQALRQHVWVVHG